MPSTEAELKELLRAAEERIEAMARDNQALARAYDDLLAAQAHEAEQMVRLSEQLWKLEEALASTSAEKEAILAQLLSLKTGVDGMRRKMSETLTAAKSNASRLTIAARVYDMATSAEMQELAELDRRIAEFNARVTGKKAGAS